MQRRKCVCVCEFSVPSRRTRGMHVCFAVFLETPAPFLSSSCLSLFSSLPRTPSFFPENHPLLSQSMKFSLRQAVSSLSLQVLHFLFSLSVATLTATAHDNTVLSLCIISQTLHTTTHSHKQGRGHHAPKKNMRATNNNVAFIRRLSRDKSKGPATEEERTLAMQCNEVSDVAHHFTRKWRAGGITRTAPREAVNE